MSCLSMSPTCAVYQCCLSVPSTCAVYLCCLPVLSTCGVYQCCLPVLATCAGYLCCLPVLATCAVYLCYIPLHLHLEDIIAYVVHLFPSTGTVAHRAANTNTMLRLCNTDAPVCLSCLQFMKSPHNYDIAPSTRRRDSVCLLHQRLEREHNQAELFSLSPDGTKLKINPEALFQRQTVLVNKHCDSPDSVLPFPAQHELRSGPSSTSAGPVLDWIYGYKAVPTQSKPLPDMFACAQKSNAMSIEQSALLDPLI